MTDPTTSALKSKIFSNQFDLVGSTPKLPVKLSYSDIFYSNPCEILLDSGAAYSCASQSFYDRLRNHLPIKRLKRERPNPSAANNTELQSLCEFELNLHFFSKSRQLVVKNVRFSVFENLSMNLICGIETLAPLGFKTNSSGKEVTLLDCIFEVGEPNALKVNSINLNDSECPILLNQIDIPTPRPSPKSPLTLALTVLASESSDHIYDEHYVINILPHELKNGINIHSLCIPQVPSGHSNFNISRQYEVSQAKSLLQGTFNLSGITSPVTKSNRILLDTSFSTNLVKSSNLSNSGKIRLDQILQQYRAIFSASDTDIGLYTGAPVRIDLKDPHAIPPYVKPRRIPNVAQEFVQDKISELIKKDIFEKSPKGSVTNSPVHVVITEKNGQRKFRLTVDYSTLNQYIRPNVFPIPSIREILDKLEGAKYFSALDLRSGFWNLKLDKSCRDLLSFSINSQQFRPLRLPMGIQVAPGIFQRVMLEVFTEYVNKFVQIYLDDILIYSKSEKEHLKHIKLVFDKFTESGILLNHTKCNLAVKKLRYLGFEISDLGWKVLPDRVKTIKNFPRPRTQKELKRFIGAVSFLTPCVKALQYKLQPLHQISGKTKKFKWEQQHSECFEMIKELVARSCMMSFPSTDPKRTLYLTTDASSTGYGSILSQLDSFGIERPLAFHSGSFKGAQERWEIRCKEFYSFYKSLDVFYDYLYLIPFVWRTDNQSLYHLKNSLNSKSTRKNTRIIRWIEFVNTFTFTVELHDGQSSKMAIADCLSRQYESLDTSKGLESLTINDFWVKAPTTLEAFIRDQIDDIELQSIKTSKYWRRSLHNVHVVKQNGAIMGTRKQDQSKLVYLVPRNHEMAIIKYCHFPLHLAPKELIKQIEKTFYFPNLRKKVNEYVKNCIKCVARKPDMTYKLSTTATSTPRHPFETLEMDLTGPYPQSIQGNKYILSVIDGLSRFCILRPLKSKEAEEVIKALDDIFSEHGLPLSLKSDCGREFKNQTLETFLNGLKVAQKFSTPYRPRSNGLVERQNKKIGHYMKLFDCNSDNWDQHVKLIALAINNTFNKNLNTTPHEIFFGWKPLLPSYLTNESPNDNDLRQENFDLAMRIAKHRKVLSALYKHNVEHKKQLETEPNVLENGTRCLVKAERPLGESSKLFESWRGIYRVKKCLDKDSYLLSPEGDHRREFICYRDRIKVIGPNIQPQDLQNVSEKELNVECKADSTSENVKLGLDIDKTENITPRYNLRKTVNDYRKFF